jgi:RNA polymerase sigma-70 factor (ECF subfamily)
MSDAKVRLKAALGRHTDIVWRVARRSGLSPEDADEVTQDAFLVLSRRLSDVPPKAERSFLIGTVWRMAADKRRAARPQGLNVVPDPPADEPAPDEQVALYRARAALEEALGSLSDDQRAVFVLIDMDDLSAPEAARALKLPVGTVASRLRAARSHFDAAIRRLHLRQREPK